MSLKQFGEFKEKHGHGVKCLGKKKHRFHHVLHIQLHGYKLLLMDDAVGCPKIFEAIISLIQPYKAICGSQHNWCAIGSYCGSVAIILFNNSHKCLFKVSDLSFIGTMLSNSSLIVQCSNIDIFQDLCTTVPPMRC